MCAAVEKWRDGARIGHTHEPIDVTIELDGLGRQLSELPAGSRPAPESGPAREVRPDGSDGPVFVDESGRRSKKFRRAGWVVAVACACYAVMLGVAVIGGSSSAPWLQIPGLVDSGGAKKKADKVEIQPGPSESRSGSVEQGVPPVFPTATDSNGALIPGPSGSARAKTTGKPVAGKPGGTKPTKAPAGGGAAGGAGGAGTVGGTKPLPGTTATPGGGTVDQPGAAGGGTGEPPVSPTPTEPDPQPTPDPTTSAAEPPGSAGGQQPAAEGAR